MKLFLFVVPIALLLSINTLRGQTVPAASGNPAAGGGVKSSPKQFLTANGLLLTNNDDQTITPIIFHDAKAKIYLYVESDGRHVTAFTTEGVIIWHRDPFVGGPQPWMYTKPVIDHIITSPKSGVVQLIYNSGDVQVMEVKSGNFLGGGRN